MARQRPPSPRVPARPASDFRPAGAALAVALAFVTQAQAQPSGAQAIHGTASLSQQGNKLVVTTTNGSGTGHSAINWQSFSVPGGTTTQFIQPSAASTSINRVLGNNPSGIYGTLSSNGRLVLVNPAGIAVGAGAMVDTAGFTASTLRMSDADALAGRLRFGDGGTAGALTVHGNIIARGGDVVLMAPDIQLGTSALVQSADGATIIAAGRKVEVTGRGLEGIHFEVQAPKDQALNLGRLQGNAVGIFAGTLRHSGAVQATAVSTEGGKVVLRGADTADIDGSMRAVRGDRGGEVHATGGKVMLRSGAVIDVSGAAGGGEALIGGGWQGKDDRVANAATTLAERGAVVNADATVAGDGGTVVLWSDGATLSEATILARGGVHGGNGGQVETSGKDYLDVRVAPLVRAMATTGVNGNWLLDPGTIIIGTGSPAAPVSGNTYTGANASGDSYVSASLITTALNAGTNVTVQTSGGASPPAANETSIRVAENVIKSGGTDATLKLVAHENIAVDAGVSIRSDSGVLNLEFTAGYSQDALTASTNGGSILLGSGSTLGSNGGAITLSGGGGTGTTTAGVQATNALVDAGAGTISIQGKHSNSTLRGVSLVDSRILGTTGGITIASGDSSVLLSGTSVGSAGGNISISATGANDNHSVDISESTVQSRVTNTGSGTIGISGNLTSGGASTGASAAGVRVSNSLVSTDAGNLTISGDAGWTTGLARVSRGFRLDSGATIGSAGGNLSLTGRVGNSALDTSVGGEVAAGATIASTGGNLTLTGTLNDPNSLDGTGLLVNGRLQSGPAGQVSLTGSATVGGATGKGVAIGSTGNIDAGSLGLVVAASVSSSTTATNITAYSHEGRAIATGNVSVTGTVAAPSAPLPNGVSLTGGSLGSSGGGTVYIQGSGVPAPAPASSYDVKVAGTSLGSNGGEITIVGNRVDIQSAVDSGTGRTVIKPFTNSRQITLGGTSETNAMNLSNSELGVVSASTIVIGSGTHTGGIAINGSISQAAKSFSLINSSTAGTGITQTAGLVVASLNADALGVQLLNAGNQFGTVSGRSGAGNFDLYHGGTGTLTVGTVDGISGIATTGGAVTVRSNSALELNDQVSSSATGDAVVLSGTSFTNNHGTGAISTSGRWIVYSGDPASDTFGGLDSGNSAVWNANYAANAPGTIAAGNRYVFSIQPNLVITANNYTKTYDGTSDFIGVSHTVSGLVDASAHGNVFTQDALTGAAAVTAPGRDVGAYAIGMGTLGVPSGYGYSFTGATATVNPAELTLSATSDTKVYDGTTASSQPVGWSGLVSGDSVIASQAFDSRNVMGPGGSTLSVQAGYVVSDGNGGANYNITLTPASGTITPANLTVEPTSVTKVYDGGMAASGSPTATGLVGGDTGSGTQSFQSRNVMGTNGTPIQVDGYTVTDGNGGANYNVTFNGGFGTITPATLTLAASSDTKVYDGTQSSSASVQPATGLVGGDTVTGATQFFQSKNVLGANLSTLEVDALSYTVNDGNSGNNYIVNLATASGTITPASLTITPPAVDKVYDGNQTAFGTATPAAATPLAPGDSLSGGTFTYNDRHAGTNKTVSVSGVSIDDGNGGNNYAVTYVPNTASTIHRRPVSTWTDQGKDGLWSNPANWDALPDANNVLQVQIPSGYSATYNLASATNLQSLYGDGRLAISTGTLNVADFVATSAYNQSGGSLTGTASLAVFQSFSQSAGTIQLSGPVSIYQASGNLQVGSVNAGSIHLEVPAGTISQAAPLVTSHLSTYAAGATTLTDPANVISAVEGYVSGSGNYELANRTPLDIIGLGTAAGDIIVNNIGAITTTGHVHATGNASLTANSPLTIGTPGILATGDITLVASNLTSSGTMILNGDVVSTAGVVQLNAGVDLVQNALVDGANGVTAVAGNAIYFGPSAMTKGPTLNYTANGVAVTPPTVAGPSDSPLLDAILDVLGGDASAETVATVTAAIAELQDTASTFAKLLIEEAAEQKEEAEAARKEDVVTDTQCKP